MKTLNAPLISLGVATVVEAYSIIKDAIDYLNDSLFIKDLDSTNGTFFVYILSRKCSQVSYFGQLSLLHANSAILLAAGMNDLISSSLYPT